MWKVITTDVFDQWLDKQKLSLREEMLAALKVLSDIGPHLGRPRADTLHGSKFPNMKELRVQFEGKPFRAFYAFDPERAAVVLCAGNKKGINEKLFYKDMIKLADSEFSKYLKRKEEK